jgi:hypothetical protein
MSWCLQRKNVELFLVYELVPNGNLHQHLHEGEEVLPWERRYLLTFLMATSISFIFPLLLVSLIIIAYLVNLLFKKKYLGEIYSCFPKR